MSTFDSPPTKRFPFSLKTEDDLVRITLYDGQDHAVFSGHGSSEVPLVRGLYTVRTELAGQVYEETVRHTGPTHYSVKAPAQYSAAPLVGIRHAEPFLDFARESSRKPVQKLQESSESGLYVLMWSPEHGKVLSTRMFDRIELLDSRRQIMLDRDSWDARLGADGRCEAFCAHAAAGSYVLRSKGRGGREIPIQLFRGWETLVFIIYRESPRLDAVTVSISRLGRGFDPSDRLMIASNLVLIGLQNRQSLIPRWAREALLYGKFEDPMLGILGAYALLLDEDKDTKRIEVVIDNLERLLGDCPDLHALRLHAGLGPRHPSSSASFDFPPVVSFGLRQVIMASIEREELVPQRSLVEQVAVRLLADSPWSTWSTFRAKRAREQRKALPPVHFRPEARSAGPGAERPLRRSWVELAIQDALEQGWLGTRTEFLKAFAKSHVLPLRVVEQAYQRIHYFRHDIRQRRLEME